MRFTFLTPTAGHPRLKLLLQSVNEQVHLDDIEIAHVLVVDGPQFRVQVDTMLSEVPASSNVERSVIYLPFNTHDGRYLGHKIYAGISQLLKTDYVLFVDDDNTLEPCHILSFYLKFKQKPYQWLYCFRNIVNDEEGLVCRDLCESLGYLHPVFYSPNDHLIDTSCYCLSYPVVQAASCLWNLPATNDASNPDRVFAKTLMMQFPQFDCTRKYTLNYYVGNRPTSVQTGLFFHGNQRLAEKFSAAFPWQKRPLFLIHFGPEQTDQIIQRIYSSRPKPSVAYRQWNMNMLDDTVIADNFHVINGYRPFIPAGSDVLIHLCSPGMLPKHVMDRKDLNKIVVTVESPNVRHQQQWDANFLLHYFTRVVTYWEPLIALGNSGIQYFPFVHRIDFANDNDKKLLRENKALTRQVCLVLEKRPLEGEYTINGVKLTVQDPLRTVYAHALGKRVDCYGDTWKDDSVVCYKEAKNRFLDDQPVIDIYGEYMFALVLENCDAEGYVSEKIYDCFVVGTIPLYYGNNSARMGIPEDCYIDLRKIKPENLPDYLDKLSELEIEAYRQAIYIQRETILKKASINAYCHFIANQLGVTPQ